MENTLQELEIKQKGVIGCLDSGYFSREQVNILLDYGFLPGTELEVLYRFPTMDRMIVKFHNHTLAIRLSDAQYISLQHEN